MQDEPTKSPSPQTAPLPPAPTVEQPPLLLVQGLWKYYRDFAAVQNVSCAVRGGEILGIVGPNGAGKTTLLRCITGILRPTAGSVICAGHDAALHPARAKSVVSFVPETPELYQLLTVAEHLRFVHMAFGETAPFAQRAEVLLQRLELADRRDALVATLSKGMRQKLAVACALIHSSHVLLFDEPWIGVDPAGQRTVREVIQEAAAAGAAVVVSSHLLDTVEDLCDRVLILSRGVTIAEGTLGELRDRARVAVDVSLEEVFLTLTQEHQKPTPGPHDGSQ